mmetsp:Transcript_108346/g.288312  ORF Transcript_108346/g.288312 Transcript_108346/m.288312 type:complete len:382 (-) Transcript_108346:122-1267(-)
MLRVALTCWCLAGGVLAASALSFGPEKPRHEAETSGPESADPLEDSELTADLENPRVQAAVWEIMSDPSKLSSYEDDPAVTKAVAQITASVPKSKDKPTGADRLAQEDRPLIGEVEAAYGGSHNLWQVQAGMCGQCVSSKDQKTIMLANNEKNWSAGIYGEITPDAFLDMMRKLGARHGQRFYDLGSGTGKTIAMAAHLFGMEATGIELSKDRHDVGCAALHALEQLRASASPKALEKGGAKNLQRLYLTDNKIGDAGAAAVAQAAASGSAELVRGSFFDYDFSDADLVFVDSVEFTDDMMARIADLARSAKEGARIASWKALPAEGFEEVDTLKLRGTWGDMAVRVFEKSSSTRPALPLPPPSKAPERCAVSLPQPERAT